MKASFFSTDFELPNLSTGQVVRVRQGKSFDIEVTPDAEGQPLPDIGGWFADEDQVLTITASNVQSNGSARKSFRADTPGTSVIQVQGPPAQNSNTRPMLFLLTVEVFSSEAASFSVPAPVKEQV